MTLEESLEALKMAATTVPDQKVVNLIEARKIELRQLEKGMLETRSFQMPYYGWRART